MFKLANDLANLDADRRWMDVNVIVYRSQLAQKCLGDLAVGRDDDFPRLRIDHVERNLLAEENVAQLLGEFLAQLGGFLLVLFFNLLLLAAYLGRRQVRTAQFLTS